MKAIQFTAPHELARVEVAEPPMPGPGEALVRTHTMGVCGTDISSYLGKFPFFAYPRIPGHELGVEVLAVGAGVSNVRPGDRCSVEPYINNPESFASRRGATNCCGELQVIGVHTNGGLCDRFVIRADKLYASPTLSYEQLALVETLAIGCHATSRAMPRNGEHTLLIGAGPIGLATLEFARLTGAQITVMDMNQDRLTFCQENYGIRQTVLTQGDGDELGALRDITSGNLYTTVIDATGNARSMSRALHFVAHTGTLVYVGITTGDISFSHPLMHAREMTLKASRNALPEDFRRILALIEQGQIDTNRWITHRTSFERAVDHFESYSRPETGVLKAIIRVND